MQVGDLVKLCCPSGKYESKLTALVIFLDGGLSLLWSDGDIENINRNYKNTVVEVISESRRFSKNEEHNVLDFEG